MRSPSALRVVLSAAVFATACSSSVRDEPDGGDLSPPVPASASIETQAARLQSDLEAQGLEVARGHVRLFTIEHCRYAIASMGDCVGNNPAAPYVMPVVPLWPDEFVDEHHLEAFGPNPAGDWVTFRMDEREAVIILAELPPPASYFSLHTYVYSRQGRIDTSDPVYQAAPEFARDLLFQYSPNPGRVQIFASIGNSINDAVIEQRTGAAWGEQRFLVVTPDAVMARRVEDAVARAGLAPREEVFVQPVATELVRAGLGPEADDLFLLIRYAHPDDLDAGEAWREALPLVVLRVRDPDRARPAEPYPRPDYDARIAQSELNLEDELSSLVGAVKAHWGQPGAEVRRFMSLELDVDLLGHHCIERPMNCLGDNQDEDWRIASPTYLDSGEVVAIVGTLGTETGNATYSSLAIIRQAVLQGVGNVFHEDLTGTAAAFSASVERTEDLFVQYVARDCTGLSPCFEVTEELVPLGEPLGLIERDYVVPGETRGALPEEMLDPWVVVLDGAGRPAMASDPGGR